MQTTAPMKEKKNTMKDCVSKDVLYFETVNIILSYEENTIFTVEKVSKDILKKIPNANECFRELDMHLLNAIRQLIDLGYVEEAPRKYIRLSA